MSSHGSALRSNGSLLDRLRRSARGGMSIEIALAVPIAVTVLVGMMEIAMLLFTQSVLEGAVRDAARFGVTGGDPAGTGRATRIAAIVADRTDNLVNLQEVQVSTRVYGSFAEVGQAEPFTDQPPLNGRHDPGEPFQDMNANGQWDADRGVAGQGGAGAIVLYTVEVRYPLLTGLLVPVLGAVVPLRTSMVVRNEPFDIQ